MCCDTHSKIPCVGRHVEVRRGEDHGAKTVWAEEVSGRHGGDGGGHPGLHGPQAGHPQGEVEDDDRLPRCGPLAIINQINTRKRLPWRAWCSTSPTPARWRATCSSGLTVYALYATTDVREDGQRCNQTRPVKGIERTLKIRTGDALLTLFGQQARCARGNDGTSCGCVTDVLRAPPEAGGRAGGAEGPKPSNAFYVNPETVAKKAEVARTAAKPWSVQMEKFKGGGKDGSKAEAAGSSSGKESPVVVTKSNQPNKWKERATEKDPKGDKLMALLKPAKVNKDDGARHRRALNPC
eukprot:914634-Prorocentrum_minimum.AAC.3